MSDFDLPPSLDDIQRLAEATVAALPPPFRKPAQEVALIVRDFPEDDMLDELELDDPYQLTGLYDGVPMTEKLISDPLPRPDTVWLFRRPILDEWIERGDIALGDLVAHVTIHEFAHHFGWSDDQIERIAPWQI